MTQVERGAELEQHVGDEFHEAVVASGPGPQLVVAHAGTIRAALIAIGRAVPPERDIAHGEVTLLRGAPDRC